MSKLYNNKCDALKDRKVYDEISVMECELAMCSSDEFVYVTKLYI